jgi:dienelactone hydrolase
VREDVAFISGRDRCAAWLYRPDGEGPHPCVVLAHGWAGVREARLWAYAERFQGAGFAALVFDYRHFGDSEGEPRQLLSIPRQLEDWHAAIGFARALEGVDPDRVAVWGTSYSGGHVVKVAAADERIAAAVSQSPHADGLKTLAAAGTANAGRLTIAGLRDLGHALTGREPYRIPVVGRPGETAAMTQPGSYDGYLSLFEDPDSFVNEYCARAGLLVGGYSPLRSAPRVRCPLQVLVMAADAVTPPEPAREMARRAPHGELVERPGREGHFAVYTGEAFEWAVGEQTAFLERHLLGAAVRA